MTRIDATNAAEVLYVRARRINADGTVEDLGDISDQRTGRLARLRAFVASLIGRR